MARKLLTMVAAAALAIGPAAQAAAPLSLAHSPARTGASMSASNDLRGSTAPVFIGLIIAVLLIAIVTGNNRNEPSNSP